MPLSFQTKNDIPDTILHEKLSIPQKGAQYLYGKRDLFALVIAFRYLLSDEDFKKFKRSLSLIFSDYLSKEHSLSQEDIYALMGFPSTAPCTNIKTKPILFPHLSDWQKHFAVYLGFLASLPSFP